MKIKTFREYLNDCLFEEIWDSFVEYFGEPPVYSDYYDKLKALPQKCNKGVIKLSSSRPAAIQPVIQNPRRGYYQLERLN